MEWHVKLNKKRSWLADTASPKWLLWLLLPSMKTKWTFFRETSGADSMVNQSNVFIKPFFTSDYITKCCTETSLKPQTASHADVEAVARNNSLERPKPNEETQRGNRLYLVEIIDHPGQIIIITVVVEGVTGQHLRSKCQLAFHSRSFRVSVPLLLSLESWKQQVY